MIWVIISSTCHTLQTKRVWLLTRRLREIYGLSVFYPTGTIRTRGNNSAPLQTPPSIREYRVCWSSALHEVFLEMFSANTLKAAGKNHSRIAPLNQSTDALWGCVLLSDQFREDGRTLLCRDSDRSLEPWRTEHFWFWLLNDSFSSWFQTVFSVFYLLI